MPERAAARSNDNTCLLLMPFGKSYDIPMQLERQTMASRLNECFIGFVKAYASTSGSTWLEEPDCILYTTPIAFPVYSGVVRQRFGGDVEGRVRDLLTRLQGCPSSWHVMPGSEPDNLGAILEQMSPAFTVTLNGMETEIEGVVPGPALPPNAEIVYAQDEKTVTEYATLYPRLFGAPTEGWIDNLIKAELELFNSGNDPFHRYVVHEDGEPVAAGMTMMVGDTAILQTLYTLQEKRGRGIGHHILARAFADERERGAKHAVIWSGPDADKLYSRAGFRYAEKATVYVFA